MEIRRVPMSYDDYSLLPFHPGWKVELWKGVAVFQPREAVAYGMIAVAPREARCAFPLRPVVPEDEAEIGRGFDAVFVDAVEYCGWAREAFAKERARVVGGFFSGKRGAPLSASRVALSAADGGIAGAALVVENSAESAQLDLLFVEPQWQRRGVATALVDAVLNELRATGKKRLIATWHLANDAGVAWYRKFGFVEEPDWSNARLYLRAAEQELRRMEHFGENDETKRGSLIAEKERWEREVSRLEKCMDEGDKAGAFASHRFSRSG